MSPTLSKVYVKASLSEARDAIDSLELHVPKLVSRKRSGPAHHNLTGYVICYVLQRCTRFPRASFLKVLK